jgi:GNAT superfamily N-acetyltransferase
LELAVIEIRRLNYSDKNEVSEFYNIFWRIPAEIGDEFINEQSSGFIAKFIDHSIATENETNTFSGIALFQGIIVGIHVLRKFIECGTIGVHSANLWVEKNFRRMGIAEELKIRGEAWADSIGATFINTNVLPDNKVMLDMNKSNGFSIYKINLRKRIINNKIG